MKYKSKPKIIEAVLYSGDNFREILVFTGSARTNTCSDKLTIETLEGPIFASVGDWIIKGIKGEFYPCKPDVFEESYEAIQ